MRAWLAAGVLSLLLLSVGCTAPAQPSEVVPETLPIAAMTPSAKRATIATSFPAEVPVPVGDFTRAEAQGEDAWDYVVEVPAALDALVVWYRDAYVGRQWELIGEEPFEQAGESGVALRFRKGNAESSVTVSEGDDGGPVRASVTLGVGTPVLLTQ